MLLQILGYNYLTAQTYCLNTPYTDYYGLFANNSKNNNQLAYNKAIQEEANLYGVHFINLFNLCGHGGNIETYLADDKIHPKAAMMTMIANQCYH